MLITIAILAFVIVAVGTVAAFSLINERQARARILRGRLLRPKRISAVRKLLAQADLQISARNFLLFCTLSGLLLAGNFFFVGQRNPIFAWLGLLAGFLLPYSYASYRRYKRFERFQELFPEAIDTLAREVRAGHTFTAALELICDELTEPLAGEFRLLLQDQKSGLAIRDSLMKLVDRVPLVDVKLFVRSVMLQHETGGNLAEILDNLFDVLRERFKITRQVRVYTAQGRLTMMLLMGMPPAIVLVMLLVSWMVAR
jgi:tight adherence protein B